MHGHGIGVSAKNRSVPTWRWKKRIETFLGFSMQNLLTHSDPPGIGLSARNHRLDLSATYWRKKENRSFSRVSNIKSPDTLQYTSEHVENNESIEA
jgi:hypothetical protein